METTTTLNEMETLDFVFGPDFETDRCDSVLETFEFLGTTGFGREGMRSLAVDLIELS